jgi:glycogen debranching enzyme
MGFPFLRFQILTVAAIVCLVLPAPPSLTFAQSSTSISISYLTSNHELMTEGSATVSWAGTVGKVRLLEVDDSVQEPGRTEIVWVHCADARSLSALLHRKGFLPSLRRHYRQGGKILATGYAAQLPFLLGEEPVMPEVRIDTVKDDGLWDKRGFQGFRGHPVFAGMFGGDYLWDPPVDQLLPLVGYFGEQYPVKGKVVGVDKAYVFIYAERKLVIEYDNRAGGRMLAAGSCIYFGRANMARPKLERFIANCFAYLNNQDLDVKPTYWVRTDYVPKRFMARSAPPELSPSRVLPSPPSTSLVMKRENAHADFYDIAGRRALVIGKENGGIDEFWVHPFRVARNVETGLIVGDSVLWLKTLPVRVERRPESFTRYYQTPFGELQELTFASLEAPGAFVHYRMLRPAACKLFVRYNCDLRWMWPYDEKALGSPRFSFDVGLRALRVKDTSGAFCSVIGWDVPTLSHMEGAYDGISWSNGRLQGSSSLSNSVGAGQVVALDGKDEYTANLVLSGTNQGESQAETEYRALVKGMDGELARLVDHYTMLLSRSVSIASPDTGFNMMFQWAIVGTDRFWINTPGVGRGLAAGYASTARGWNGGHKVSGRPGYAWYFGRDSEWAGLAIDDYGDFTMVRSQLEFLGQYQDATGKIFHEVTTSGVVHFDASDATPLYIVLAGHYLRASGDTAFIRSQWSRLLKAIAFLYSTDTDGDLLIENTNVGHGWQEGGELFGSQTEFYLAALWCQALSCMGYMATALGEMRVAEPFMNDAARVREVLNRDFWNPDTHFFNHGKLRDGSYNPEPTVPISVGLLLDLVDDEKARYVLDAYAGSAFSPDWGIRMVRSTSPLFKTGGYNYGNVWLVSTGWTSLAEYEYGNSTQAFTHLSSIMHPAWFWTQGFVPEVIDGARYAVTGVCPHQLWSETAIIAPAIEGMVGWKPDAPGHAAVLVPRFPFDWDSVTVSNLAVGSTRVRLQMKRTRTSATYTLEALGGPPITMDLMPELLPGSRLESVLVDGTPVQANGAMYRGVLSLPVRLLLEQKREVLFRFSGGVGVCPVVAQPRPGDTSSTPRVISSRYDGKSCRIVLEGGPGSSLVLTLVVGSRPIARVTNATRLDGGDHAEARLHVVFPGEARRIVRQEVEVVTE